MSDLQQAVLTILVLMLANAVALGMCVAYRKERNDLMEAYEEKLRRKSDLIDEEHDAHMEFWDKYREERAIRENMEKRLMMIADILNPDIEYDIESKIEEPEA